MLIREGVCIPPGCIGTKPIKPDYLQNSALRLLLFGGKGGVGKTTLAVAAALSLAQSRPLQTVLLLSTDPAHSLSDSLGMALSDGMTPVPWGGAGAPVNLYARELSAEKLATRFRQENGEIIQTIAERGTYFDHDDIAGFFDLSLPGIDEVMAILEVGALLSGNVCDLLVLDTAPTGHTLRFLDLPAHMRRWIGVMDLMLQKHRYMSATFSGKKYVKDRCDLFLEALGREIAAMGAILRDPRVTRFVPVMNPEMMSFCETETLVAALEKTKIPLREIVVNRVVGEGACCFCRGEKGEQLSVLGRIKARFHAYDLVLVERDSGEVRGLAALSALALRVSDHARVSEAIFRAQAERAGGASMGDPAGEGCGISPPLRPVGEALADPALTLSRELKANVESGLEFIVVGGKGGVGKSTVAASVGLFLAERCPDKKVLIFSTDPAHSLSDAFDMPIGDRVTPVSANLAAYEIDAEAVFEKFKAGCREEIQVLFDRFLGNGMDIAFDREVMAELVSMAPPGLDEIMALDAVMDLKAEGYDVLVVDASPTGHLMRFLEMPALVRQWLKAYFTVLIKYKGSVKLTKTVEKVLALSRNVRRIQEALTNREKTSFIGVTLLETMVLSETERLLAYVDQAGIPCGHLVINRVMPETHCPFCAPIRKHQTERMATVRTRFPHLCLTEIPLFPHAVQGRKGLAKVVASL